MELYMGSANSLRSPKCESKKINDEIVGRERKSTRISTSRRGSAQQPAKESAQQQANGRPLAEAAERSTGSVDRRAQMCTGRSGRPARSTAEGERSTARSTD